MRAMVLSAVMLAALVRAPAALAGPLKSFEEGVTKEEPAKPRHEGHPRRSHHDDASDDEDSGFWSAVAELAAAGIVYGGVASLERARGATAPERDAEDALEPRRRGEALIPLVRVDGGYQSVRGGVDAFDVRGELGYALAALQVRHTSYWDRHSDETMSTTLVQALYRMSLGSRVEVDAGGGLFVLKGVANHSGSSFSIPVLIHPSPYYGFELRPTWCSLEGHTVRDFGAAVRLGGRYASVLAGYRWVESGAPSLDGPEVGLALVW